jgi:hypothetical protein
MEQKVPEREIMLVKGNTPPAVLLAGALLALLVPLHLAGCSGGRKADAPPRPQPQVIPAQYTVTVQFPADGKRYESGFLASPGDVIRFDALEGAASLERGALLFYVGGTGPFRLANGRSQQITTGGHIVFRAEPGLVKSLKGQPIQIRISNIRKD